MHVPLEAPPLVPEQVQEALLPWEGNAEFEGLPEAHWVKVPHEFSL
jgi:hypothetical protein